MSRDTKAYLNGYWKPEEIVETLKERNPKVFGEAKVLKDDFHFSSYKAAECIDYEDPWFREGMLQLNSNCVCYFFQSNLVESSLTRPLQDELPYTCLSANYNIDNRRLFMEIVETFGGYFLKDDCGDESPIHIIGELDVYFQQK